MAKTEGTYIQVACKNVFGYISTNSWPFFMIQRPQQTSQLATEKIQNLCNRNRWSGLLQLGSVRFQSFFQSSELDLQTLVRREGDAEPSSPFVVVGARHVLVMVVICCCRPWSLASSVAVVAVVVCGACRHSWSLSSSVAVVVVVVHCRVVVIVHCHLLSRSLVDELSWVMGQPGMTVVVGPHWHSTGLVGYRLRSSMGAAGYCNFHMDAWCFQWPFHS